MKQIESNLENIKKSLCNIKEIDMNTKYLCEHCNNTFGLKYNYDRHITVCNFFKKTHREQQDVFDKSNDPLPSYQEMFHLLKDLNLRVQILEKENIFLKRIHHNQTKKINILSILNSPSYKNPDTTFLHWFKTTVLSSVHDFLSIVFETDLISATQQLLKQVCSTEEYHPLPLKVFEKKNTEFYAFLETDNQWVLLTPLQLETQIKRIFQQFLVDFNTYWIQPNIIHIEKEESYKDMYVLYYKKILGDDQRTTEESKIQKIRQFLYQELKQPKDSLLA
jgi:hypothetical protein